MFEPEDFVTCRECGVKYKQLNTHLKYKHNMSSLDYKINHPDAQLICNDTLRRKTETKTFNRGFAGFVESIEFLLSPPLCTCGCGERVRYHSAKYILGHTFKGKKHTETTKEKLRILGIGRSLSNETRRKIGVTLTGRQFTEEHKRNIGLSLEGRPRSESLREKLRLFALNRVFTDEERQSMSKGQLKRWMNYTPEESVLHRTGRHWRTEALGFSHR